MTVSSVAATSTTPSQSTSAADQLSSNFDTFLTLLTTQLKNQDPLQPMDSSQFTQQLVQFSQVEQQINANKNLETLISLTKAGSAGTAVSYLGKQITMTDGTAALQNGKATWDYTLGSASQATSLVVTDANNKVVYSGSGETAAGAHSFSWDGKDNAGDTAPDGTYTLRVTGKLSDGSNVTTKISSTGTVDEVNLTGSEPVLMIGAMAVPLSEASIVSN